jgi:hypothetical protein
MRRQVQRSNAGSISDEQQPSILGEVDRVLGSPEGFLPRAMRYLDDPVRALNNASKAMGGQMKVAAAVAGV